VNRYRVAVCQAEAVAWVAREWMRGALTDAVNLVGLAWSGGASQRVEQVLAQLRHDAGSVADAASGVFVDTMSRQPRLVDASCWQARWRGF